MIELDNKQLADVAGRRSIAAIAEAADMTPKTAGQIMRGEVQSKTVGKIAALAAALGATAVKISFVFPEPETATDLAPAE